MATNAARQLQIFGHKRHPTCVDSAKVPFLEHEHQIIFCGALQRHQRLSSPSQYFTCELIAELTHAPSKGEFVDEEVSGALVSERWGGSWWCGVGGNRIMITVMAVMLMAVVVMVTMRR